VIITQRPPVFHKIFTGCIKDYKKAVIVGTTTYGKGIVQIYHELSDGSAVKLTMAKYFTPAGNDIHGIGIEPDVEVELDEEQRTKITVDYEDDNQLQEALKQF
jgi:carboxyl-terminal processing protease